jgi:hypothetical protein
LGRKNSCEELLQITQVTDRFTLFLKRLLELLLGWSPWVRYQQRHMPCSTLVEHQTAALGDGRANGTCFVQIPPKCSAFSCVCYACRSHLASGATASRAKLEAREQLRHAGDDASPPVSRKKREPRGGEREDGVPLLGPPLHSQGNRGRGSESGASGSPPPVVEEHERGRQPEELEVGEGGGGCCHVFYLCACSRGPHDLWNREI